MLIQRQHTYWECTSSQYKWVKEIKEGTNFDSTQNEYAQTCSLNGNLQTESGPVHNTVSGQRRNKLSLNTKSMLSMHKDIHSKATYNLRAHQFPTQQVGKGDKRRNKFSLNTKWVCTNMFIEWQLTVSWEYTSSQHSKWVKKGDKRRNEFSINTKWVCTNMLTSFKGN